MTALLWETGGGQQFIPVFTSEERLVAAAPEGTAYVRLETAALLDVLEPEAVLGINPCCGHPSASVCSATDSGTLPGP